RGEASREVALAANGTEGRDQLRGFRPERGVVEFVRRDAEGSGEVAPELRMIRVARFFVDQIGEQPAAGRLIIAARVYGGEIGRESGDVSVILTGVISQRGHVQFAARPGEIKWMGQQMT